MDRIGADIALGGDIKNVVRREDLSWAELLLMRDIHGEASVTNVEVVGVHPREEWDEMNHLKARYGRKFVRVYGRNPQTIPLKAPAQIARWDDIVEVQTRRRRDAPVPSPFQVNAAYAESEAQRRERAAYAQGKGDRPGPYQPPGYEVEDEDLDPEPKIVARQGEPRTNGLPRKDEDQSGNHPAMTSSEPQGKNVKKTVAAQAKELGVSETTLRRRWKKSKAERQAEARAVREQRAYEAMGETIA